MKWRVVALPIGLVLAMVPISMTAAGTPQGIVEIATSTEPAERIGRPVTVDEPPPPPPTSSPEALAVLELVNAERTSRGLQPMVLEQRLNEAAQTHTAQQAAVGDIYHFAPDGTGPGDRISAVGYAFSAWGENVAAGYRSAEAVMVGWMTSPGHCRNVLNPAYTELGVGYLETDTSYRFWWSQKFARPKGEPAPAGTYDPAWC